MTAGEEDGARRLRRQTDRHSRIHLMVRGYGSISEAYLNDALPATCVIASASSIRADAAANAPVCTYSAAR